MLGFTSLAYLVFLAVSAALYRFCPLRLRTAYLLLLSYLFYVSYNLWAAALLAGATLATFTAARLIDDKESEPRKPPDPRDCGHLGDWAHRAVGSL